MVLVNILVFLISLSTVIILHELGHFVMARRAGILCHEFSIGMGPIIWSKRVGETNYLVKLIPMGGYVMMSGEEIEEEIVKIGMEVRVIFEGNIVSKIVVDHSDVRYEQYEKITVEKVDLKGIDNAPLYINDYEVDRESFYVFKKKEYQIAPYDRGFNGKTIWQRFLTIFSGPLMNFLLALVVFFAVNLMVGFPNMDSSVLGTVGADYPANGVLEVGDEVLSINGEDVDSWEDLSLLLAKNPGDREIEITVLRGDDTITETLTPILYFFSFGFHSSDDAGHNLYVGKITEDTKASKAGMLKGDRLVSIDGVDVTVWYDVIAEISRLGDLTYLEGRTVEVEVERNGTIETLTFSEPFSTAFLNSQNIGIVESKVGVSPEYNFSLGGSIVGSFVDVKDSSQMIFTTIGLLFDNDGAGAGVGVDNLAGPLGIYQITSAALSNGFVSLLSWIGLLSVNLGVINLLPIPALDGGRLVFLGYEAVGRRKMNRKVENTLNYVMFVALMGLFVFITFNDLLRLFSLK